MGSKNKNKLKKNNNKHLYSLISQNNDNLYIKKDVDVDSDKSSVVNDELNNQTLHDFNTTDNWCKVTNKKKKCNIKIIHNNFTVSSTSIDNQQLTDNQISIDTRSSFDNQLSTNTEPFKDNIFDLKSIFDKKVYSHNFINNNWWRLNKYIPVQEIEIYEEESDDYEDDYFEY